MDCHGGEKNVVITHTLIKTWVTGEKATLEEEDIQIEIFELARE
jgi:hypothetical protein